MPRKPVPWYRTDRKAWFVTIRGKRHNLGPDREAAWEQFRRLTETAEPSPAPPGPSEAPTKGTDLNALAESYLGYYRATRSPDSYKVARARLSKFRASFGQLEPDRITPGLLEQWAAQQGWSPSAANGVITVVNSLLNWCVRERKIASNPVKGVVKPSMGRRSLLLTDEQVKRLQEAASPDLREMIDLLEHTGARPHVLCQLSADSIDWSKGIAVLTSKRKRYVVYLSNRWLIQLKALSKRYPTGPLLRTVKGKVWQPRNIRERLERLGDKFGIKVYPYAFRHRFATRKLAEGVAPAVVANLLNHADLAMISRHYSHVGTMHDLLRGAID